MNVFEDLQAALKVAHATQGLPGSARATWRIGEGRVTTEELESWQLGPDLSIGTQPKKLERRARRRA